MVSLSTLPVELILAIAKDLTPQDLASLIRTARLYAKILTSLLYDEFFRGHGAIISRFRVARQTPQRADDDDENKECPVVIRVFDYDKLIQCIASWQSDFLKFYLWNLSKEAANTVFVSEDDGGSLAKHTLLVSAIVAGNVELIKMLPQRGASLESQPGGDYIHPLVLATMRDNESVVRLLLEAGADPLYKDPRFGVYAILLGAVRSYSTSTMKLAVEAVQLAGGTTGLRGKQGTLLLYLASGVEEGHMVARLLEELGADPLGDSLNRECPLMTAVLWGNIRVCEALAHPVPGSGDDNASSRIKNLGLIFAVMHNKPEIARFFLDSGADVLAIHEGVSALGYALRTPYVSLGDMVLNSRPRLRACPQVQECFEDVLNNQCEHIYIIRFATRIARGELPSVNLSFQTNDQKSTLLHQILSIPDVDPSVDIATILKGLIKAGATLTAQDARGLTPLHLAASFDTSMRHDYISGFPVSILWRNTMMKWNLMTEIMASAVFEQCPHAINVTDNNGLTPLQLGIQNPDVVDVLVKYGADVNTRDAKGQKLLHAAALCGHDADTLALLISHGADRRALDNDGLPPAHFSAIGGRGVQVWDQFIDGKGPWHDGCDLCGQAGSGLPAVES